VYACLNMKCPTRYIEAPYAALMKTFQTDNKTPVPAFLEVRDTVITVLGFIPLCPAL
jgi:hypothetical protein